MFKIVYEWKLSCSVTHPTTTQEIVVPMNAKAMMDPRFLKKCLCKKTACFAKIVSE